MKSTTRKKIALAALLHDIGKFWQRGDVSSKRSEFVSSYEQWGDTIVPLNKDKTLGYKHALWTHRFVEDHNELFTRIFRNDDPDFSISEFASLAARHHRPEEKNTAQAIISMADKWASKNERVFVDLAPEDDDEKEDKYWGSYAYKKIPLHNMFDLLDRNNDSLQEENKHVFDFEPLRVLGDGVPIFPKKLVEIDKNQSREEDYRNLWKQFLEEFKKQDHCKTFEQHFTYIQSLLQKYCWCIPSSTIDMPYSNLYEHQKVVSGIAVALWDAYQEYKDENHFFISNNYPNYGWQLKLGSEAKDPTLMLCLDLSGIQNYIYDIATRYAAKALKGRSYDLQLIMQSLINEILQHEDISLFPTNIIYASGGKAYLILPNTNKVEAALHDIQKDLEQKFYEQYGFGLYPAIGWVSFQYRTTYKEDEIVSYQIKLLSDHPSLNKIREEKWDQKDKQLNLGDLWRAASDEAAKAKSRKYNNILKEDNFFIPQKHEAEAKPCTVTGIMTHESQLIALDKDSDLEEDPPMVTKEVERQVRLGHQLAKVDYLTMGFDQDFKGREVIHCPGNLGTSYKPYRKQSDRAENPDLLTYQYNDTNIDDAHGYLFYGGNVQPIDENANRLSFHDFCKDQNGKDTKLGVLKMDVDNLGQLFIKGLHEKDKSFSAYSTLSFMLETFFSGYINNIRNSENFKDHIQIIYSGGDDVFAVGRWDKVIEFAKVIKQDFRRLTCRDDIATLSAGIAIVRSKFPISKAADLADEAESASKNYPAHLTEKKKNALTIFGETVSWSEEFSLVQKLKDDFLKYKNKLSTGFLHKLQNYKIQKDEALRKNERDFSYKWHAAYTVARMLDTLKKNKENNESAIYFLTQISNNMMHNEQFGSDRYLDLVALAARWAEYLLKIQKGKV